MRGIGWYQYLDSVHPRIIREIEMQADQYMRALGIGDALPQRQIAIVVARQYDFYSGETYGFQRDQMRDFQHNLFFKEIVHADAAGIVASVSGIYGNYGDGCRLACTPSPEQTDYQKPKTKRAHRLTDHHPMFIIQ